MDMTEEATLARFIEAVEFFKKYQGVSRSPAESMDDAKERCARENAAAEREGRLRGWTIETKPSDIKFGWQGGEFDVVKRGAKVSGRIYTGYWASLFDEKGNKLNWMLTTFENDDPYHAYRRVLFAQFASEAIGRVPGIDNRDPIVDACGHESVTPSLAAGVVVCDDCNKSFVNENGALTPYNEP